MEDGTDEQKRLVRGLGVPMNPKSFYDTADPTPTQYAAHSKLLTRLEGRGFITRSAEQYKPHVKLTSIGHLEAKQLRHEAWQGQAGITQVSGTETRRSRARLRALQRYVELAMGEEGQYLADELKRHIKALDKVLADGELANITSSEHLEQVKKMAGSFEGQMVLSAMQYQLESGGQITEPLEAYIINALAHYFAEKEDT